MNKNNKICIYLRIIVLCGLFLTLNSFIPAKEKQYDILNQSKKRQSIAIFPLPTFHNSTKSLDIITTNFTKPYFMWVRATAYCPCELCCGKGSPGITSTGRSTWKSGVAVDPKIISLGSHLDIPEYNRGPNKNGSWILCDDIGGKIKGRRIDVRFDSHSEAIKWGSKKIKIRIHKK